MVVDNIKSIPEVDVGVSEDGANLVKDRILAREFFRVAGPEKAPTVSQEGKTITRKEFDKLPLYEQAATIKSGVFPIDA
jgi:hypothetical protein